MQLPEDPRPNVNHLYFAEYVLTRRRGADFRVLDYGCGRGEIVRLLRNQGVDCVGCEVFYAGASQLTPEVRTMLREGVIISIEDERPLPFPGQTFDIVIANMVFEHVRELEPTLLRLAAVTRPDGLICLHFPSREVIREAHIGIPFAHWFSEDSPWRWRWTRALRRLGFGHYKDARTVAEWTRDSLGWVDKYCYYRPYSEIKLIVRRHFMLHHNEIEYIRFRARSLGWLRALFSLDLLRPVWQQIFRRVGFMVLELHPLETSYQVQGTTTNTPGST